MNEIVKDGAKKVVDKLVQDSPKILTGLGIAGFVTAIFMSVRDTKRYELKLDEAIRQKAIDTDTPEEDVTLEKAEMVKVVASSYWPTAVIAAVSAICICASDYVMGRRLTALAAAYTLTEKALTTFQEKAVEKIGEEKVKQIKDEIAGDQIKANPPTTNNTVLIAGGDGKTLCFDPLSGRYFYSDMDTIRRAVNCLNESLFEEMFISLNELYGYLGLPALHESIGETLGWDINHNGSLKIDYTSKLTDDGVPCLVLNYRIEPYFYDMRY